MTKNGAQEFHETLNAIGGAAYRERLELTEVEFRSRMQEADKALTPDSATNDRGRSLNWGDDGDIVALPLVEQGLVIIVDREPQQERAFLRVVLEGTTVVECLLTDDERRTLSKILAREG